jgi:hypothetical protein
VSEKMAASCKLNEELASLNQAYMQMVLSSDDINTTDESNEHCEGQRKEGGPTVLSW